MRDNLYNDDDRQYLQMMQENITRMSNNSANCKTWMITIVTGILAIGCKIEELDGWIIFALVPIIIFWYLDAFYLSLERGMRNRQRDFLNKASDCDDVTYNESLYEFTPLEQKNSDPVTKMVSTEKLAASKSVNPLYLSLLLVVLIFTVILNYDIILEILGLIVEFTKCVFN